MEKIFEEIRDNILEKENRYADYACKSIKATRLVEEESDIRPAFARDVDRIINTHSYTRYMDKTQVFSEVKNDHVSRRMMHVQLVAKIARTIGRALNLNEDLIESTSLGHDVGHVPFGHMGETYLNEISEKEGLGIFMHNVQSVRTFMYIENNGNGCNLALQTLDGIMCHNGELLSDVYEPQKDKTWDSFIAEYNDCYNNWNTVKKLRPMTLEGCVTRVSDIIGYIGRDIEDAILLGVFDKEKLPESISEILGNENKNIVNELILDIVKNSYGKPYIKFSEKVYKALMELKKFNYENIYRPAISEQERENYRRMFETVYYETLKDLETNKQNSYIYKIFIKDISEKYIRENSDKRKVLDYICGMTDKYFLRKYDEIKEKNA